MDEREDAQGSRGTPTQRKLLRRTSTAADNSDGAENSDGVEEEVRPGSRPPAPPRRPKSASLHHSAPMPCASVPPHHRARMAWRRRHAICTHHITSRPTPNACTPQPSRWPTFLLAAVAAQPTARLSYGRTLRARTSWIQGWKRRLRWGVSAARHRRHRRHVMGGARWAVRQVCQMRCAASSAAPGTRSGGAGTARYCARRATSRRARPVQQPPSGAWAIACTQGTAACAPCRLARRSLRGRPQPKRPTRWLRAALRGPSG